MKLGSIYILFALVALFTVGGIVLDGFSARALEFKVPILRSQSLAAPAGAPQYEERVALDADQTRSQIQRTNESSVSLHRSAETLYDFAKVTLGALVAQIAALSTLSKQKALSEKGGHAHDTPIA
jgi:hypothetical protein